MIAGPFVASLTLVGVIAIIVWLEQWASDYRRSRTATDILDERFAKGRDRQNRVRREEQANWQQDRSTLAKVRPQPRQAEVIDDQTHTKAF